MKIKFLRKLTICVPMALMIGCFCFKSPCALRIEGIELLMLRNPALLSCINQFGEKLDELGEKHPELTPVIQNIARGLMGALAELQSQPYHMADNNSQAIEVAVRMLLAKNNNVIDLDTQAGQDFMTTLFGGSDEDRVSEHFFKSCGAGSFNLLGKGNIKGNIKFMNSMLAPISKKPNDMILSTVTKNKDGSFYDDMFNKKFTPAEIPEPKSKSGKGFALHSLQITMAPIMFDMIGDFHDGVSFLLAASRHGNEEAEENKPEEKAFEVDRPLGNSPKQQHELPPPVHLWDIFKNNEKDSTWVPAITKDNAWTPAITE